MIVTAINKNGGIFIPFESIKNLINKEFSKLVVDIKILQYKNEIINKTSGLLKSYNKDGVEYENTIRKEWE